MFCYHRYEQPGGYRPAPVDLSQVLLSSEHQEVVNLLAENDHNVWARERIAQGWTYGTQQVHVQAHTCIPLFNSLCTTVNARFYYMISTTLGFKMKSVLFRMSRQSGARTLSPTASLMKRQGGWAETASEKWLVPYWPLATAWTPTVRNKVRLWRTSHRLFQFRELLSLKTAIGISLFLHMFSFHLNTIQTTLLITLCIFLLLQPLWQTSVSSLLRNAECSGQISRMLYPGESGTLNLKQWQQGKWELAGPGPAAAPAESWVLMTGPLSLMDLRWDVDGLCIDVAHAVVVCDLNRNQLRHRCCSTTSGTSLRYF